MSAPDTSRLMLAKARNKLETAMLLYRGGRYDDYVSRSYYAVFHALNAVLITRGFTFSSHAQTIGVFNREFVKSGVFPKEYSQIVQSLFEDRQTGDYDFDSVIDEQTARESIENAEKIISGIEKYLNV